MQTPLTLVILFIPKNLLAEVESDDIEKLSHEKQHTKQLMGSWYTNTKMN